ncbi:annexin D5-like protein [Tanacetum coccineum]
MVRYVRVVLDFSMGCGVLGGFGCTCCCCHGFAAIATALKVAQLLLAFISIPCSERQDFYRFLVDQDARALYKAGEKRWGTDETTFRSIFSERSRVHLAAVSSTYKIMYGNTLRKRSVALRSLSRFTSSTDRMMKLQRASLILRFLAVPSNGSGRSSVTEQPLERLLKVVKTISPAALSASVSDIGSVVSMIDMIAGSTPETVLRLAFHCDFRKGELRILLPSLVWRRYGSDKTIDMKILEIDKVTWDGDGYEEH